jgi:Meiotically up-regulated gene 113
VSGRERGGSMQYSDRLKKYRSKYGTNNSQLYNGYVEFVQNEIPTHNLFINKANRNVNINLYLDTSINIVGSFSVWAYVHADSAFLEGQMFDIRFSYSWDKFIFGEIIKQWLPKTFCYYLQPKKEMPNRILTEIEIIDLIENFFEAHPKYDLRKGSAEKYESHILERFASDHSFIYLIRDNDKQVIKIGRAKNPKHRYRQIDSDTASSITLLATVRSHRAKILDRLLQCHFSYKRHKKEWYNLNNNDVKRLLSGELPYPLKELFGEVIIYDLSLIRN